VWTHSCGLSGRGNRALAARGLVGAGGARLHECDSAAGTPRPVAWSRRTRVVAVASQRPRRQSWPERRRRPFRSSVAVGEASRIGVTAALVLGARSGHRGVA